MQELWNAERGLVRPYNETPDYVVTYIVEETLDPLIEEIDADLREEGLDPGESEYFRRFWARVTDLKVLDPAGGSVRNPRCRR